MNWRITAYHGHTTSTHEKDTEYATQPRGLGAHKKTIRINDSSPQLMDYSDSEDGLPPSPKRLQLVDHSDTDEDIGGVAPSYELVKAQWKHMQHVNIYLMNKNILKLLITRRNLLNWSEWYSKIKQCFISFVLLCIQLFNVRQNIRVTYYNCASATEF